MNGTLAAGWWALAIRGVAGILLGVAAFALPGITLYVIVVLFAAYVFVDGIFALVAGIRGPSWLMVLEGALGIVAGLIALIWAPIAALALVLIVATWAIVTGFVELIAALRLRAILRNEWLLGLAGVASIAFGLLLAFNPAAALLTIVWIIGAYALVFGVLTLALAFRLRGARGVIVAGAG